MHVAMASSSAGLLRSPATVWEMYGSEYPCTFAKIVKAPLPSFRSIACLISIGSVRLFLGVFNVSNIVYLLVIVMEVSAVGIAWFDNESDYDAVIAALNVQWTSPVEKH